MQFVFLLLKALLNLMFQYKTNSHAIQLNEGWTVETQPVTLGATQLEDGTVINIHISNDGRLNCLNNS